MNLKIVILSVFKSCGDWATDAPTLHAGVNARISARVGDGEFNDALVQLRDKGWIDTRISELTGDTLYFITEKGKTKVSQ